MYQAKVVRARSQNDLDELQEQNKWLEWSDFTALIAKLRSDWDDDHTPAEKTRKPAKISRPRTGSGEGIDQ